MKDERNEICIVSKAHPKKKKTTKNNIVVYMHLK